MSFSSITLVGFTFATLCAGICPMNSGMMPMKHEQMDHGMHANTDQEKSAPCEHCEGRETEEALFLNTSVSIDAPLANPCFCSSALFDSVSNHKFGLTVLSRIAKTKPPPLALFITNKVVLRT